jgi:hypothetical protein
MLGGRQECCVPTHRLADQRHRGKREPRYSRRNVDDERLSGQVTRMTLAATMAALIQSDHVEVIAEYAGQVCPLSRMASQAVQHQHSCAATAEITTRQSSAVMRHVKPVGHSCKLAEHNDHWLSLRSKAAQRVQSICRRSLPRIS